MLPEIILVSLWGGLVSMDTTAFLQIMTSRPLVTCTVVGLILGNLQLGLLIGMLLELAYISELPVGAAKFSESNVGAVSAAAVAELCIRRFPDREDAVIFFAILTALAVSAIGGFLVSRMRSFNTRNYTRILELRQIRPRDIAGAHRSGLLAAFLLGFFCVFISSIVLTAVIPYLLMGFPHPYDRMFKAAIAGLLAAECVFLIHMFWTQTKQRYLIFIGAALGLLLLFLRMQ
ncbi:MAG: PTS sugar transporter subunit IIC [candidate division KSB1 bacterium]|nr:PTS sugar transporter subunit IIC [candidate division KSB1 bacterium]